MSLEQPYRKATFDGIVRGDDEGEGDGESPAAEPASDPASDPAAEPVEDDAAGADDEVLRGAIAWVNAPDVDADYAVFVVDESGGISIEDYTPPAALLDEESADDYLPPDGTLDPFADAVEGRLRRPYRTRALRELGSNRFAVVAQEVETVLLLSGELTGDDMLVLAMPDGARVAVMDGLTLPIDEAELNEILDENAPCLVTLSHIERSLWEVVSVDHL